MALIEQTKEGEDEGERERPHEKKEKRRDESSEEPSLNGTQIETVREREERDETRL